MIKSLSIGSLLPFALLFATCSFVSLAQPELTCESNGCDGCCTTSNSCYEEHTLVSQQQQCSNPLLPTLPEAPLIPGLQQCPFDFITFEFVSCPNSHVDDRTKSVGDYGKPNWVGAEFQSINYDSFSMTVMWEHADAEVLSTLPGLSPVQGYEIRIYEKEARRPEITTHCVCVTDPSMRNISNIRSSYFTYRETSHMTVEVRSFPSLTGEDESNMRRNCSLLTGCATTDDCSVSHDDCYSWPQSCLSFLPYYDPLTCTPPLYSPPVNVIAERSLVDDDVTNSVSGKLNLSWEPPRMNYELFPVPNTYYITIVSAGDTFQFIKAVGTTNVTILHLNITSMYRIFVRAYIPCSGLGWTIWHGSAGCGLLGTEITVVGDCAPPTPPLHGWLGKYKSTSLHSTVTFQCDFGWSPSQLFTTICMSTDRLEWVPDPANHTCSGMLSLALSELFVVIQSEIKIYGLIYYQRLSVV